MSIKHYDILTYINTNLDEIFTNIWGYSGVKMLKACILAFYESFYAQTDRQNQLASRETTASHSAESQHVSLLDQYENSVKKHTYLMSKIDANNNLSYNN